MEHNLSGSNGHNPGGILANGYKRVGSFDAGTIPPDAPEGQWEATIVRNKTTVKPTSAGDPRVRFLVRLDTAEDDANESYQGTVLDLAFIFFDDNDASKRRGSKMNKTKLQDLARQINLDLGIIKFTTDDPAEDLKAFVEAVEGQKLTVWTQHRRNKETGEVQVEVNLRKPGSYTTPGSGTRE